MFSPQEVLYIIVAVPGWLRNQMSDDSRGSGAGWANRGMTKTIRTGYNLLYWVFLRAQSLFI